jgi:glycerophosphoryl diester phosphodiesterase
LDQLHNKAEYSFLSLVANSVFSAIIKQMKTSLIIAHRGDSSTALENSLESIRRALSLSVDMIEIDIRMSRDKELYVMHDKKIGRTAMENIDIEESTTEEISRIRLKNGEQVPRLADVLGAVSGACGLNLEIKSSGAGAATAKYLLATGYQGYVLVSSFKEDEVIAVRRVMPGAPTSIIFDNFSIRDISSYKKQGYDLISLRKKTVSKKLVAACHGQGIRAFVWTVDDDGEMKKLIGWGVDGIYSNKPGLLKQVVRSSA